MPSKFITGKSLTAFWPSQMCSVLFFCCLALIGNNFQEYSNSYQISNAGNFGASFEHIADAIVPTSTSSRYINRDKDNNSEKSNSIDTLSFGISLNVILSASSWSQSLNFTPPDQGGYSLTYTSRAPPISQM